MCCYFYAQFDTYVLIASRLLIWFITCERNKLSNEWITKLTSIQGIFIDTPSVFMQSASSCFVDIYNDIFWFCGNIM